MASRGRSETPDAPNPLTLEVTGWSSGHTKFGDAEFLAPPTSTVTGRRGGVLVGSVVLKKRLVEGLVEEWSDDWGKYVVTETLGRVEVGEVVSLKYTGDAETWGATATRSSSCREEADGRTAGRRRR